MLEWIVVLAAAGGSALISAAATDAWGAAREGVLAVFGRAGDRRREMAAARLDADAAAIESAADGEREAVRAELLLAWQTRLADLLEEFPEAREELQAWATRINDQLPPGQQAWEQNNTARECGTVFAVQGGTQHVHQTAPPGHAGSVAVTTA
jgi:hypothetical protein